MKALTRHAVGALLLASSTGIFASEMAYEVTDPDHAFEVVRDMGKRSLRINGQVMHLEEGTASAWVSYTNNGIFKVGVTLDEGMLDLNSLPSEGQHHDAHIALPQLPGSPYTHLYFAWNPGGHAPDSVYNIPHFDFHFSLVEAEYLEAIDFPDPEGQILPPNGYMPASTLAQQFPDGSYVNVPGQGVHWYYNDAPEWNGGAFTETFLWGSYDGNSLFMEPMVTYDTIMVNDHFEKSIELPECFNKAGFYATKYGWKHRYSHRGEMRIDVFLSNFEYKTKSDVSCGL